MISREAAAGLVLAGATVTALLLANSPLADDYQAFFATHVSLRWGSHGLDKPLLLWINDGLMAIFFLAVGIEIKHELTHGTLSTRAEAALPIFAAAGGVLAPALCYIAFNARHPSTLDGWAIPAATDIAFAVAVLAAFGNRVPPALKVFLTAIAVLDDLAAIVIIAAFYTDQLDAQMLGVGIAAIVGLAALNRMHVTRTAAYIIIGAIAWVGVLKSGVHATLAGVAVGLALPQNARSGAPGPAPAVADALAPWVAFGIMPVFALANAGVSFSGFGVEALRNPVTLGIIVGLVVGKPLGVIGVTWLAVATRWARLPPGTGWGAYVGMAALCGIGFTMSLFIGSLAFEGPELEGAVRRGVLAGSSVAAAIGAVILWRGLPRPVRASPAQPPQPS